MPEAMKIKNETDFKTWYQNTFKNPAVDANTYYKTSEQGKFAQESFAKGWTLQIGDGAEVANVVDKDGVNHISKFTTGLNPLPNQTTSTTAAPTAPTTNPASSPTASTDAAATTTAPAAAPKELTFMEMVNGSRAAISNLIEKHITGMSEGTKDLLKGYGDYLEAQKKAAEEKKQPVELLDFDHWVLVDEKAKKAKKEDINSAKEYLAKEQEAQPVRDMFGKYIQDGRAMLGVVSDKAEKAAGGLWGWLGENGGAIGVGLLGLLGGLMLGLDPIMALLLALVGFALGGMMDKNGVMSGLFGGKKEPAPTAPGLVNEVGGPAPTVSVEKDGRVQVVQKDKDNHLTFLSGKKDEKGNDVFTNAATPINIPINNADHKVIGYLHGVPSTDGVGFVADAYTPVLQDGGKNGIPLNSTIFEKPVTIQLDEKGNFNPLSPSLKPITDKGTEAITAFAAPIDMAVKKGQGTDASVTLADSNPAEAGKYTFKSDGKEYLVVLDGTVTTKDGKESVAFNKAHLVEKQSGDVVKGPDGGPVQVDVPAQTYVIENGKVKASHNGVVVKDVNRIGADVLKAKDAAYTKQRDADTKELGDITSSIEKNGPATAIQTAWFKKLQNSKADDAAVLALAGEIAKKYSDPEFQKLDKDKAALEIEKVIKADKNVGGTINLDEAKKFAARTFDGIKTAVTPPAEDKPRWGDDRPYDSAKGEFQYFKADGTQVSSEKDADVAIKGNYFSAYNDYKNHTMFHILEVAVKKDGKFETRANGELVTKDTSGYDTYIPVKDPKATLIEGDNYNFTGTVEWDSKKGKEQFNRAIDLATGKISEAPNRDSMEQAAAMFRSGAFKDDVTRKALGVAGKPTEIDGPVIS